MGTAPDRPHERHERFTFDGGRAGTGPATWGQRAIWDAVAALGPDDAARYTVRGGGAVAPGYDLKAVLGALSALLLRHDSLRTRFAGAGDDGLRQTVAGSGDAVAVVVDCPLDEVGEQATALLDRLGSQPFDTAAEWPIRVGVVAAGGEVRHIVLAVAHTAVDGWGLRHLVTDLADLTRHGAAGAASVADRLQPLDEAEYQHSKRGRRQDAAARKHWCAKVERGPHELLAVRGDSGADRRFPNALLDSPALGRALPAVAARLGVSPAALVLAGAAKMIGQLGGADEALFQVVVNNRFQPGLDRAVSTVAQEGLFHVAVAGAPFDELVRGAFGASLAAYRHAYYDKAALDRDLLELRASGTGRGDLTCFVNDTRGLMPAAAQTGSDSGGDSGDGAAGGSADPAAGLRELRRRSFLSWPVEFPARAGVSFALDAVDLPGSIGLTMTADPDRLPRGEMERLLFGIEDLVLGAAERAGIG